MAGKLNIIGDTGLDSDKPEKKSTIPRVSRYFENDDAKKLLTFFNTELHDFASMHIDVNIQNGGTCVELRTDKQYEKKLEEVFSGLKIKIESLVRKVIDCKYNNKEEIVRNFSKNSHILPIPSDGYDKVRLWSDNQTILDKALNAFEAKAEDKELKQSSRRGRFNGSKDLGASGKYEEIDDRSRSKRNSIYTEGWKPDIKLNFKTSEGLKVKVYKGSIVKLQVDAIVNAANEHLANGAGVAGAISEAAGFRFDRECKEIIQKKGQIPVTENYVTRAGELPCRAVIHAVGPQWYHFHRKEECLVRLKETVVNVLTTAYERQFSLVVMPPISSGIFGVPKKMCAAMYILGIIEFSESHPNLKTSIEELHIIDIKDDMLYNIEESYRKWLDDPASLQPAAVLGKTSSSDWPRGNSGGYKNSEGRQKHISLSSSKREPTGARPKEVAEQKQNCTFQTMGDRTVYLFRGKLSVHVYKGDITKTTVDAIVSTENRKFDGSGGLSRAIRAAAGQKYCMELERMFGNQKLYHSHAERSSPGKLKQFKCIFHVIIEQLSEFTPPKDFELRYIENGIKNVLEKSNDVPVMVQKKQRWKKDKYETLKTIAMPLLGAGAITTELYIERCCTSVFHSLLRFANSVGSVNRPLNLQEVHLVDNRGLIIQCMNKTFEKLCANIKGRPLPPPPRTQNNELLNQRHRKFRLNKSGAIDVWKVRETGDYDVEVSVDNYMEKVQAEIKPAKTKERKGNLMIISEDHTSDSGEFANEFDPLKVPGGANAGSTDTEVDDCIICMDKLEGAVKLKKCGHMFCRDCVSTCFRQKPVCPVCNTVYGCLQGDQPIEGKAFIHKDTESLPGYKDYGTIIIDYEFANGIQGEEHPQPEESYKGLSRQCYLPDNRKGKNVLQMLKQAFEQRLIFTIGQSRTSGEDNVLTWNDIHHKTRRDGGPEKFGYPDSEYLDRVEEELNAKGIE